VDVEVVAEGLAFPEGPAVDRDGVVHVVEIAAQRVTAIAADGTPRPVAHTGGGPNGAAFLADGSLVVCNNGGRWPDVPSTTTAGNPPLGAGVLQRVATDGTVTTLLEAIDGRPLNAPNDCAVDAEGGIWFTDPQWGSGPLEREGGAVCYLAPDGRAVRAWEGVLFPNGIGITEDGRFLVVCESMTGMLMSFPVKGPGQLGSPKPNGMVGRRSVPDGFCFDSRGRMIVAGHQTANLFVLEAADGRPVQVVDLPEAGPTNACFGGPDHRTLFVTSSDSGRLLAIEWPVPGMRLFPDR
jgi:gluconolactonase